MIKISIIIVNFNGEKETLECLESLEKIAKNGFELNVVVVDNGSNIKFKVHPPVGGSKLKVFEPKIIRSEVNLGFSGGNNLGIEYAIQNGADYILLLNNDTLVDKNFIIELLKIAKKDSSVGVAVPKIYFAKGFEFHKQRYQKEDLGKVIWYAGGLMDWRNVLGFHRGVDEVDNGQYEKIEETGFASGCCMFVKREVLEKAGVFDDKYFLYYEDSDLSQRVKKLGYKIIFAPDSIIWHKNAGSAGGSGSSLQDYYISRNRLLFGFKYASLRSKIALFKESLNLLINGRKWQKTGIIDFYLQKFGKGSFNT